MRFAGISQKVQKSLMGHRSVSPTVLCTKVFTHDVAARHRVQFNMQGTEAVSMLKDRFNFYRLTRRKLVRLLVCPEGSSEQTTGPE
ncbi:hypothetical protein SB6407_02074 [Klebsiella pasteurii]|nr:hypothetical protein SB6407_02074 [Klebsiella pasteurii]